MMRTYVVWQVIFTRALAQHQPSQSLSHVILIDTVPSHPAVRYSCFYTVKASSPLRPKALRRRVCTCVFPVSL